MAPDRGSPGRPSPSRLGRAAEHSVYSPVCLDEPGEEEEGEKGIFDEEADSQPAGARPPRRKLPTDTEDGASSSRHWALLVVGIFAGAGLAWLYCPPPAPADTAAAAAGAAAWSSAESQLRGQAEPQAPASPAPASTSATSSTTPAPSTLPASTTPAPTSASVATPPTTNPPQQPATLAPTAAPTATTTPTPQLVPQTTSPAEGAMNHKADRSPQVHLVSHRSCSNDQNAQCNKEFIQSMNDIRAMVSKSKHIQMAHTYTYIPEELMSDPRWKRHLKPGTRGRGYWFWKAALIHMLLKKGEIRDGDTVVWADADTYGKGGQIAEWSRDGSFGAWDLVIGPQPHCEHVWTKGDIFQRFGTTWDNPHYGLTQQPKADAWGMRVNERTRRFLRMWEDLMADFHLVSDEPSHNMSLDGPDFHRKENRHDQSLLSMLIKASVPRSGPCNEPDFRTAKLQKPEDEVQGWQRHPEFGIEGFKVVWRGL